jgi:hypothetical protein
LDLIFFAEQNADKNSVELLVASSPLKKKRAKQDNISHPPSLRRNRPLSLENDPCAAAGWLDEEDELLLSAVEQIGTKDWKKIADSVITRTANACHCRYQRLMGMDRQQNLAVPCIRDFAASQYIFPKCLISFAGGNLEGEEDK